MAKEENIMPTYAGNLIGRLGDDGTAATGVAANYRRVLAPFSNFGTRQIAFFKVVVTSQSLNSSTTDASANENTQGQEYQVNAVSGTVIPATNVYAPNSMFNSAVNGVQVAAEVCYLGSPAYANADGNTAGATLTFVIGAYVDTAASANADMQAAAVANAAAQTIATAVTKALPTLTGAGAGVAVNAVYFSGGSLTTGAAY